MVTKKELLNFLRRESKLMNISFYCNDFEFADRLLEFINSQASDETKIINENEQKKKKLQMDKNMLYKTPKL